ncbi:hypothetical protein EBL85_03670 [Marichromatium sp. AB32]|nr:hypothetical protein EBL85_03670 [Marichromatium sp. AB32]
MVSRRHHTPCTSRASRLCGSIRWSLVAGRWSLVAGRWSLVAGGRFHRPWPLCYFDSPFL